MNFLNKQNFASLLPFILALILCFFAVDIAVLHAFLLKENAALKKENSLLQHQVDSDEGTIQDIQHELEVAYRYLEQEGKLEIMRRLQSVEPEEPVTILDKDLIYDSIPKDANRSIQEVLNQGKKIPFTTLVYDENWEPLAYLPDWHSTVGRWSYVPNLIHHARHRIFPVFPTASIMYDHMGDLGIPDTGKGGGFTQVTVLQGKVIEIRQLDHQVVFVYVPARKGYHHLSLEPGDLLSKRAKQESFLFQLVTPEGYEIDYAPFTVTRGPKYPPITLLKGHTLKTPR